MGISLLVLILLVFLVATAVAALESPDLLT